MDTAAITDEAKKQCIDQILEQLNSMPAELDLNDVD
jgi:hypothetical protein